MTTLDIERSWHQQAVDCSNDVTSTPLCPARMIEGVICVEQWASLAEALGGRKRTSRRRNSVVSGVFRYEPNLRVQALSTVVHRLDESVVLRCTECSHPMSSSWYFVHPRTGVTQVLTPMNGHAHCRRLHQRKCHFRSEDRGACITDNFNCLDFCEHVRQRQDCAACGGCGCCVHGRQRRNCRACAPFVKRRKKCLLCADHLLFHVVRDRDIKKLSL